MNIRTILINGAALVVLCAPAAFAQSAPAQTQSSSAPAQSTSSTPATQSSATTTPNKPAINQRKTDQQDRIANGVQSGQLTAGETKNLESKEQGLNKEENNMRSQDDGHLTAADRSKINGQQNAISKDIYQDKHNANTAHYGQGEIGQRKQRQQDRIAQGIRSGQLTAGETKNLENKEQGINRETRGMRQANGGKLTQADKRAVNQQQNKVSRQIYNKKHNSHVR
jgi:hypothetical protein